MSPRILFPTAEYSPRSRWPLSMRWPLMGWRWMFAPKVEDYKATSADPVIDRGAYLVEGLGHCGAAVGSGGGVPAARGEKGDLLTVQRIHIPEERKKNHPISC